jgi:hypothetical protein
VERVPTLLPLTAHPLDRPYVWEILRRMGSSLTVVVNVDDGPGTGRDPCYTTAMSRLAGSGVRLLGNVPLAGATRPIAEIVADINRWAGYPVRGVFLDRAPATPFAIGPVAIAIQAAQRAGLADVVLNPGVPPDPTYRDLGTPIVSFDGSWREYRRWSAAGARLGDGHLVHAVPPWEFEEAFALQAERGGGFGLVTDLGAPDPYEDLPAWCAAHVAQLAQAGERRRSGAVPAGNEGRRTTTGS